MKSFRNKFGLWMAATLCILPVADAARIYVDASAAPGGNGQSWATAFRYLQDALDQTVSGRGDDVWIAAGTYFPDAGQNVTKGDRLASFFIKDGVAIYGGFAGGETELDQRDWEENATVLSGKILGDEASWSGRITIVEPSGEVRLNGITITGGRGHTAVAVFCSNDNYTVLLENSLFINNHASSYGGVARGGTWTVMNSTFIENSGSIGGGVATGGTWTVKNSMFIGNSGSRGAVASTGEWNVFDSTFIENHGYTGGVGNGGVWVAVNSTFYKNTANSGGISFAGTWDVSSSEFIENSSDSSGVSHEGLWTVTNSTFNENAATGIESSGVNFGGSWTVINSTFTGNKGVSGGVARGGTWTVINSTFSGNTATGSNGGGVARGGSWIILNSIVDARNSEADGILFREMTRITDTTNSSPDLNSPRTKNIIQGGMSTITMSENWADPSPLLGDEFVVDVDPLFVDPDNPAGPDGIWATADDGLRLQHMSSAINQGNADFLLQDTFDLDNNEITDEPIPIDRAGFPRVQGSNVDLGAYEFQTKDYPIYSLTVQSTAGGNTSPSGQNNHTHGTELTLTASPSPGYVFEGWTGGLESPIPVLTFTISSHMTVTANFGPDLADDDNDGLTNYQEIVVYGTDPNNPDTSGDGILDGQAVAAGLSPLADQSAVLGLVNSNPEQFGMYTEESIMDLRMGGLMMRRVGNSVEVEFTIEKASDLVLGDWEDYQTIIQTIDLPESNSFMRLRAGSGPQD